ncbi:hypothetical protein EKD04_017325 [Chloroflexales bacterium ZM16-3]|nr:hypothetical protein [Chloroflexales bacterium ZM16-3]
MRARIRRFLHLRPIRIGNATGWGWSNDRFILAHLDLGVGLAFIVR